MRRAMGRAVRRVGESATLIWESRPGRCVLILVAVVMVAYGFLGWLPKRQVAHLGGAIPPDVVFQRENEARQTWAGILGGLLVLGTLYFTWRRVEVAQEGQITERFTRAIDQLGSNNLAVILGGIYALERIARDSEKDHWPIMEVLTAYVRAESAWTAEKESQDGDPPALPPYIQAILTVLGRRRVEFDPPGKCLDLSHTDLRNADLLRASLAPVNLLHANLAGAMLIQVDLQGAAMSWAILKDASLEGAKLNNAYLNEAILEDAHLSEAELMGAKLHQANLRNAMLYRATMSRAFMPGANLAGAILLETNLSGTDLSKVEGLTREQIERAITDEKTILPECLKEEGANKGEE